MFICFPAERGPSTLYYIDDHRLHVTKWTKLFQNLVIETIYDIYIIYRCISTFPCNTKRNYYILSSLSYPKRFKDLNFLPIFVPSSLKEIRFRIKFISVRDSWNSDNFKSQLSELAETSIPIPYPVRTRGIRLFDTGVRLSTASHNFRVIAICSCDGTDLSPRFSSF